MKVVKCKVSNNFMSKIFRDEIELSESELPKDVSVAGMKGNLSEDWFWVYFTSKEFIDIDEDYEQIPEMTLWFGPRRK